MRHDEIVAALNSEITRLTNARDLLLGSSEKEQGDPTPPKGSARRSSRVSSEDLTPKRRGMSAEGKARIAAAQRKRWAKQKTKGVKRSQTAVQVAKRTPSSSKSSARTAPGKAVSKRVGLRKSDTKRTAKTPAVATPTDNSTE